MWLAGIAQLLTGISSPLEVVLAFAAGITVGAGVLVLFGVPDRRIGPDEIAAALGSAGLRVSHVAPAAVETKGSRPFVAVADDGTQVFVKVLGSDNRDADLLYRAYRLVRLRDVGDTRPAASLIQAVEHQALVAVMAERAGMALNARYLQKCGIDGLGAIEAALVAGLAGAGMSSGLAVSAVLLYRLATYWLPVAPGWVSLRLLQRWGYV